MGIIVMQAVPFAVKCIACETKGITFANNQSEVCQKCEKIIKTSDVALLLVPFATLDALIDCEFPVTHELRFFDCFSFQITCVHDCHLSFYSRLRCNPVLTGQLHQDRVPVLAWPYIILKSIQTRSRFCWAIE